jgi:hypothetical protein
MKHFRLHKHIQRAVELVVLFLILTVLLFAVRA